MTFQPVALGPWRVWWRWAGLLLLTGTAAYHNSFSGPFVFDDVSNIIMNPTIRELWPSWREIVRPLPDMMSLRPLTDRTFALNYALGGLDVRGYHVVNLAIHLLAGLVLFGILRRTLSRDQVTRRYAQAANALAFAAALLWVVHPLQTQSVTYVVQRAESLMGLWYLLTLYSVARADGSTHPRRWFAASILSCALGMATKPVMITAPLTAWLYDWMFLARSCRELWRQRAGLYLGLGTTWLILAGLMALVPRDVELTMGFGLHEATPVQYVATQPGVILHYLRLAFWPYALVLDYNWPIARTFAAIGPPAIVVGAFLGLTAWALARRHPAGFLGAWFFMTLAPTSSFFPLVDLAFEHRMYLALAAPLAGAVLLGWWGLRCLVRADGLRQRIGVALVAVCAAAMGYGTIRRNADYRSDIGMWQDVARKRPSNPRPHDNLSYIFARQGRLDEAEAAIREAIRLKPESLKYRVNLGNVLQEQGRFDEAKASYMSALRQHREDAVAYSNLGNLFSRQGHPQDAIEMYVKALECMPHIPELHHNLGHLLAGQGRFLEAIEHFSEALRLNPRFEDTRQSLSAAHSNWGAALFVQGRLDEALKQFSQALRVDPGNASAKRNLSKALAVKRGVAVPRL